VGIYEGDIILGKTSNVFSYDQETKNTILWARGRFHAVGTAFSNLDEFLNYCDKGYKVIGNIHEEQK